ncbi:cupin domain-containing protein [Clostridium sp. chh4-2]|uniref:cupin domain-containing protein n=1 Tax=unclassified Clostridium TaxID=2614128 RepID=UPI000CCF2214|nr:MULTISPECIES: cupin domain-containing protein [unclassified Clostridium]MBS6644765.1 cupin domain-containing protein [Clostridiaceae bacterium]MBT9777575.1 cupin domain-containing protein [Clostridium sp. MCC353]PNV62662.1 cupin domain-containing protein [Clostridium sp. chh4-2]
MYVENKNIELTDLGGGVVRKVLAYSENLMSVELHFDKGAVGAKHSHPHEQIGYLISGSLLFQEEGKEDKVLVAGDTYYVAPDVPHGVVALEETMLLDIFTPMRKDFV